MGRRGRRRAASGARARVPAPSTSAWGRPAGTCRSSRSRSSPRACPRRPARGSRAIVGAEGVREDHRERVLHAAGKGYPDLVRLRAGTPDGAPDAVVHPRGHEQVAALLAACAETGVAVVPVRRRHERRRRPHAAARAPRGGRRARDARPRRAARARRGVGDGHGRRRHARARARAPPGARTGSRSATTRSPTSTSRSAAARRPARRARPRPATARSRRWCSACGCAAPAAEIALPPLPATRRRARAARAARRLGGDARRDHRGRPARPAGAGRARLRGRLLRELRRRPGGAALAGARARAAGRRAPLRRGRDADVAGAGGQRRAEGQDRARLPGRARLRRQDASRSSASRATRTRCPRGAGAALRLVRRAGGLPVGSSPGRGLAPRALRGALPARRAARPRRDGRDARDGDAVVEPARAFTRRSRSAIAGALEAQGTPGLVMCHVSHVYESGASLYFTFLARQREGDEIEQWRAVKRAAGDAIVDGRRHDHPPPRDRRRPRAVDGARGRRRRPARARARPRSSSTPPGS